MNTKHLRNVPGRKSDVLDCQWLQQMHSFGLLAASFRPKDEICVLRSYLRHRDTLVKDSTVQVERMQKALTQMNVLLHNVLSDITGVMGNLSTHKSPSIKNWLAKRPRFHVHFTPSYGSWLNLVERWFALLEQRQLRRASHRSRWELEQAIKDFIDVTNEAPKPFVWTKTADAILASIVRFAQRSLATHAPA